MKPNLKINIVIPALNEEKTIEKVLLSIPKDFVQKIIVVDTMSHDKTNAIAKKNGAEVVTNKILGYDAACYAGAQHSLKSDVIIFMHAGGDDDQQDLLTLINPILNDNADLVIGARNMQKLDNGLLLHQQFGTMLILSIINLLFLKSYHDIGPFRAIRTKSYMKLHMESRKFSWTTQMMVKALKQKMTVIEVPIHAKKREGKSKIAGSMYYSLLAMLDMVWSLKFIFQK